MTDQCVAKINVRSHPNQFQCPIKVEDNHKKCIFHRPIEEKEVYEALEAVNARLAGTEYSEFAQYPFERAYFDNVSFELFDVYYLDDEIAGRYLEFTNSTIESVDFNGATGDPLSESRKLEADLSFSDCKIHEILFRNHPNFGGGVSLEDCTVETITGVDFTIEELRMSLCEVEERVILPEMEADVFQFNGSYGGSFMRLEKSEFNHLSIYIAPVARGFEVPDQILLGLRDAQVERGDFSLGDLLYADLTRSELQDVALRADDSCVSQSRLVGAELGVQTLRALEDEFLRIRDPLASYKGPTSAIIDLPERNYHETARYQIEKIEAFEDYLAVVSSYADLRSTAEEDGRSTLASTLFYWEKDWLRRYRYLDLRTSIEDIVTGDRRRFRVVFKELSSLPLKALKPVSYSAYRWITGYNEKPLRIFLSSIATVLLFSLVYMWTFQHLEVATPYGHTMGYFLLSLESFTTLVLNTNYAVNNLYLRFIATSEGFIGAFMIALFVVVSIRSLDRL